MANVLSEGYAAGDTYGDEWLTVWGSYYRSDLVYATQDEAEERAALLRERSVPEAAAEVIVRRVRRQGGAFRILPGLERSAFCRAWNGG